MAARQGVSYTPPQSFASFDEFNAAYAAMVEFIQTPDDLERICGEIVADNAADGVRYMEPMMLPAFYAERFAMSERDVFRILRDAFASAGREHNVEVGILLAGIWTFDIDITERAAEFAASLAGGRCWIRPLRSGAANELRRLEPPLRHRPRRRVGRCSPCG